MSRRLDHTDKFIVNRIEAGVVSSYKTTAKDIGDYLLEAPRPPGSNQEDRYINDGPIIVNDLNNYVELHSANEFCEGNLTFKGPFFVNGIKNDVQVEFDFEGLTDNLACIDGGIDSQGTCLSLDMEWLADEIICDGKGLHSPQNTSCIGINLCPDNGLEFDYDTGCLKTQLCDDLGIITHPNDGCLMIDNNYIATTLPCGDSGIMPGDGVGTNTSECIALDMKWLSNNIRCDSSGNTSGLGDGGDCIYIDYEYTASWLTKCSDNSLMVSPNDSECIKIDFEYLVQWITKCHESIVVDNDYGGTDRECIRVNMCWVADRLQQCDPGLIVSPDGDEECIKIDYDYVTDHITACHPSIIQHPNDKECIKIDVDWLVQWITKCHPSIIVDSDYDPAYGGGGDCECIRINMKWLVEHITKCEKYLQPDGTDKECIDFKAEELVTDITACDKYLLQPDPNSVCVEIDVDSILGDAACDPSIDYSGCLSVNVGWLCSQIGSVNVSGCLTGGGSPCGSDVSIGLNESCLKINWSQIIGAPCFAPCTHEHDDGGGGGPSPPPPGGGGDACVNGGILYDNANDCLYLDDSDSGCIKGAFMNLSGLNIRTDNGISFNTNSGPVAGFNLNPGNQSFRLEYGSSGGDICKAYTGGNNVLRVAMGGASGRLFRSEAFNALGKSDSSPSSEGSGYIKATGSGRHELVINEGKRAIYPQYVTDLDKTNWQARQDDPDTYKNENPYQNFYDAAPPNVSEVTDVSSLNIIEDFDLNIDTIVDALGRSKADGGLFRWGKLRSSETQKVELFFDPNELGALAPVLAKGYYSAGSYVGEYFEDDNHLWIEGDLKPEDQRSIKYYEVDHDAVSALSFVAHRRTKQRVAQVEADVASLETAVTRQALLATLGVKEYLNNADATDNGLVAGKIYFNTTDNELAVVA